MISGWATNQRPLGGINIDYVNAGSDSAIASKAFGSYPSHARWDRRAVMAIDNVVDGFDLIIIARRFGEVDL